MFSRTPQMYERDAVVDHMISFYLSFHSRPFNIMPIWARNIKAGRLPVFCVCHSSLSTGVATDVI
jgi:hypothetical protein